VRRHGPPALALLGLVAYLLLTLPRLTVFPPVGEDEPWIASAPYKLATQGVFGSDLFTGYYGMERHQFEQMPVFPLVQAGLFRLFGVGVAQMRALPVACGLLLLLAIFAVGRQLGGDHVGLLALLLMVSLRVADGGRGTGILLLDQARINRYDIAVPVFGLLALWTFDRAERNDRGVWYGLTGLFTGLSSLSHLYGGFWLPVLVGLLVARHGRVVLRQRHLWILLGGFAVLWLPWVAYITTGWSDYLGQMRLDAPRFDLLNPRFYVNNALHENGPISLDWSVRTIQALSFGRIGTWTMLIGTPAATFAAFRRERHESTAVRALAAALLTQTAMFAGLMKVKQLHYMIALWPLAALLLAWLGIRLWERGSVVARLTLPALLTLIVAEGAIHVTRARGNAYHVTPYDSYESEVASCIPPGALVLGLQHYWLGLRQYRYRTWLLPIDLANPLYSKSPIGLEEALEQLNPDVILIDRYIEELMREAANPASPNHAVQVGFEAFKERRHAQSTCVVRDQTYGTMQVYLLPAASLR
jgi:4-amino-4-deoxy-L-arabinose transferase-like glycosyltransferase